MKGRSRTGGKTTKKRARRALESKRDNAPKTVRDRNSPAERAKSEVARLSRELNEALERATATAEVLTVINSSPGDLTPVFDVIAKRAMRLCDATFGGVWLIDGDRVRAVAAINVPRPFAEFLAREAQPLAEVFGRRTDRPFLHVVDLKATKAYQRRVPITVAMVELSKARTFLGVPLYHNRSPIGIIGLYRDEVHPFTDKQIELVQNFAAQAVIAIENTRLLNELRQRTTDLTESLEQQTGTAEVLKVISSSPGKLEPVFESLLANAKRLCSAQFGNLWLREEDAFRTVAMHGATPEYTEARRRAPLTRPAADTGLGRVLKTKQVVQIPDIREVPGYVANPVQAPIVQLAGARTMLSVPMLREEELLGVIEIYRTEVNPFTKKQVELLQNFAAQAVIAIENARLLNELRESLEQQTATANVLRVISASSGELERVFEAMLQNAVQICDAKFGNIYRWDDNALHLIATHNTPPALAKFRKDSPIRPSPKAPSGRMVATKTVTHIADVAAEQAYTERDPSAVAAVELGGIRTLLNVPMLNEN